MSMTQDGAQCVEEAEEDRHLDQQGETAACPLRPLLRTERRLESCSYCIRYQSTSLSTHTTISNDAKSHLCLPLPDLSHLAWRSRPHAYTTNPGRPGHFCSVAHVAAKTSARSSFRHGTAADEDHAVHFATDGWLLRMELCCRSRALLDSIIAFRYNPAILCHRLGFSAGYPQPDQ